MQDKDRLLEYMDSGQYAKDLTTEDIVKMAYAMRPREVKVKEEYKNTYGRWQVTTEGDCEGRTTTDLGIHLGHVDDIAFYLADKALYGLEFKKLEDIEEYRDIGKEVHVQFDIESETWNKTSKELTEDMKQIFMDRPVGVEESNYYASFKLTS